MIEYYWPISLTEKIIKTNQCIPATPGTVLKYDWPYTANYLLREYFKELADEIL